LDWTQRNLILAGKTPKGTLRKIDPTFAIFLGRSLRKFDFDETSKNTPKKVGPILATFLGQNLKKFDFDKTSKNISKKSRSQFGDFSWTKLKGIWFWQNSQGHFKKNRSHFCDFSWTKVNLRGLDFDKTSKNVPRKIDPISAIFLGLNLKEFDFDKTPTNILRKIDPNFAIFRERVCCFSSEPLPCGGGGKPYLSRQSAAKRLQKFKLNFQKHFKKRWSHFSDFSWTKLKEIWFWQNFKKRSKQSRSQRFKNNLGCPRANS
jgi:hypothetical protein